MKEKLYKWIDEKSEILFNIADRIYDYAEPSQADY